MSHRLCLSLFLAACVLSTGAYAQSKGRVIILGFDGADPHLTREMMDKGELPNLKKLATEGSFQPLESSNPPQSPSAWSSFNTCKHPLNHGIFDFLKRTPKNYLPGVGFGTTVKATLGPDGAVTKPPQYVNNVRGKNFWKEASDQGKRVKALVVPFAYPADDLSDECRMLAGLDVPDIRGTQSTYFAFSEAFGAEESVAGGMRMPLVFTDNKTTVQVPGLAIPGQKNAYAKVPVTFGVDRAAGKVLIEVQGQKAELAAGEWSPWMEWDFEVSPKYHVRAISRFHAMNASDKVRVYMTCLQFHPKDPMIPISDPPQYASQLAEKKGLYKTIGWEFDTKALQQGDMTEEMFLQDVKQTLAWTQQLTLDEMSGDDYDLLIAATTSTDRVSHMFWGYRDPKHPLYTAELNTKYGRAVEDTYKLMDAFVGEAMAKLKPGDLLMVMSDHGFHSFRREFSVNTWLIENGYLAIRPGTDRAKSRYLQGFDWSKTKAYGLGLGMIFINLQGREGQGTVAPADAPALIQELQAKLEGVTDPETGEKVFRKVYVNINPKGTAVADAPDLQLGYAEGYQTSKLSAAGGAPTALFESNTDKWSGEHASSDPEFTQGILFSNQKLGEQPALVDLGVTALNYIGAKVPGDYEGKSLLK